jgi:hypothetical protein
VLEDEAVGIGAFEWEGIVGCGCAGLFRAGTDAFDEDDATTEAGPASAGRFSWTRAGSGTAAEASAGPAILVELVGGGGGTGGEGVFGSVCDDIIVSVCARTC